MGEVVAGGPNPSMIEEKKKRKREKMMRKKENKRKKKEERKEQLEMEEEKQWGELIDQYELEIEELEKKKEQLMELQDQLEAKQRARNFKRMYKYRYHGHYWERVWKSDGFDIEGLELHPALGGMLAFVCKKENDCPILVSLYAKTGLHRYNMLEGTNLQLHRVKKYNRKSACCFMPATYYITLEAVDPATGSVVPFQISSHERSKGEMDVRFIVARPQETGTNGAVFGSKAPVFYYVPVQESELKENDWIRLYLELGFVSTNRRAPQSKLSDLKIVEVMVETKEDVEQPSERLKGFIDAVVYIKYDEDLGEGQVCKRRAIITRFVDLESGHMSLKSHHSLEVKIDESERAV
ncbi:unnamed protein product [Microthlaspi erraticum]|uniref:Uncharacterized protein n=1 Tax=Microthlaspi erraticum TaxID=1685480 RepID=A0A6D2K8M9_9BRAS|nr:unnamed protein product [Microthlaspi erraticum]